MIFLATLSVSAAAYAAPLALPKPTRLEMVVVKTQEDIRDGKTVRGGSEVRYDKTIETREGGYRVTLKPTATKLSDDSPDRAKALAAMSGLMSRTIIYTADPSLQPLAIEDWPSMAIEIRKSMAGLAGDNAEAAKSMDAAASMFANMSAQQAAGLMLKEDGFLSIATNVELSPDKPAIAESLIPSPLGGSPIKGHVTLALQNVDKARGVAYLRWTQTLDPESVRASLAQLAQTMMARMGSDAAKPEVKTIFEKISFDRTSRCDFEVDLKTGLPIKADCNSKLQVVDPVSGGSGGRNEHWVITQTLKN